MLERRLNLQHDAAAQTVAFECDGLKQALRFREGFDEGFICEAVVATGMAEANENDFLLRPEASLNTLVDVVTKMLDYFQTADVPTAELVRVKDVVDRLCLSDSSSVSLPLLAYAWLDVMVREHLASDARDAADVWTNRLLTLDAEQHCERLVKAVLRRHEQPAAEMHRPRMSRRVSERGQQQSETG